MRKCESWKQGLDDAYLRRYDSAVSIENALEFGVRRAAEIDFEITAIHLANAHKMGRMLSHDTVEFAGSFLPQATLNIHRYIIHGSRLLGKGVGYALGFVCGFFGRGKPEDLEKYLNERQEEKK